MDLQQVFTAYFDSWQAFPIPVFILHLFISLIIWRGYTNARIYFGTKSYVKKTNKLRRKKFSGLMLNEFTEKRRKKRTNTYKNLRSKAKSRVEKYFQYKEDELPGITNYSYSKLFKRNKSKLFIIVSDGHKKIMKIQLKKATKQFIELVNTYECLDEFVQYLHNLPDAIMNQQDYDIYINDHDVSIGYEVK